MRRRPWHHFVMLAIVALLPVVIAYDQCAMLLGERSRWTGDPPFDATNWAGAIWDVGVYFPLSIALVVAILRHHRWGLGLGLFLYGGEFSFVFLTVFQLVHLLRKGYTPHDYQVGLGTALAIMSAAAVVTAGVAAYVWWQRERLFVPPEVPLAPPAPGAGDTAGRGP